MLEAIGCLQSLLFSPIMVDLLLSLMLSPAAFAALVAALYWMYPLAILHGYKWFGGYLYAGLHRKFVQVGNINYSYFERLPSGSAAAATTTTGSKNSSSSNSSSNVGGGGGAAKGPVTLLFVHGFSGNKTMWMVVSKHLPREWRLVMLDMPGHGESGFDVEGDYTSRGMAEKLDGFIDALGLTNLHLVGVSMGSLISAIYASTYPSKVQTISLMCIPVAHKLPNGVKTEFFEKLEQGKNVVLPNNAEEFQQMMELVMYNPSAYTFHHRFREALVDIQKPNYDYLNQIMGQLNNDEIGQQAEAIYKLAESIQTPTLILWGDSDKICHPSGAAIAGKLIKGSKVVMVEKCGHAMTMDRPRKCAVLISSFIRQQILKSLQ